MRTGFQCVCIRKSCNRNLRMRWKWALRIPSTSVQRLLPTDYRLSYQVLLCDQFVASPVVGWSSYKDAVTIFKHEFLLTVIRFLIYATTANTKLWRRVFKKNDFISLVKPKLPWYEYKSKGKIWDWLNDNFTSLVHTRVDDNSGTSFDQLVDSLWHIHGTPLLCIWC